MAFSHVLEGFPCDSAGKESTRNVGDLGSIPGLGRSLGNGKGYPLQYSGLENSMIFSPWGRKESDTTERLSLSWFLEILTFCLHIWLILNSLEINFHLQCKKSVSFSYLYSLIYSFF